MPLLSPPYSLITRHRDGQPLRTKIVATIGKLGSDPSYKNGIRDENNNKVTKLDYDYLVRQFYDRGVDIIRLNLSHLELNENVNEIGEVFPRIKSAILKCEAESEKKNHYRKRIAILADLPGPKVRFHLPKEEELTFAQGDKFTIHFDKIIPREEVAKLRAATVYIDELPLKRAFDEFDAKFSKTAESFSDGRLGQNSKILENAFGTSKPPRSGSFQSMVDYIQEHRRSRVLVFVGDGEIILRIKGINPKSALCEVVVAKRPSVKGDKGFTLKGVDLNIPAFTETDQKKLDALLDADYRDHKRSGWEAVVGFIGLSFTQTAHDVLETRQHTEQRLRERGLEGKYARLGSPSIIAKIETRLGWKNHEYILDVADGIMVARGDLGLQMEIAQVPHIQKKLIKLCNKRGKPVITATEMLKSMTESIEPTRAEGADVFNAIIDGSDAVMTSEETASGEYPLHSISKAIDIASEAELHFEMKEPETEDRRKETRSRLNLQRYDEFLRDDSTRIERNTTRLESLRNTFENQIETQSGIRRGADKQLSEKMKWRRDLYHEKFEKSGKQETTNCITQATCTMSESEHVEAIVAATTSGRTVRMIVRLRPSVIVIGAAHDHINTRKLALSYGVIPICIGEADLEAGTDGIFSKAEEGIIRSQYLKHLLSGEVVVFTAGTNLGDPGTTNSIQMREISGVLPDSRIRKVVSKKAKS